MMKPSENLEKLSIVLPNLPEPVGVYVPALRTGNMVYTSGQLPMCEGKLTATGKVPTEVSLEDAHTAARQAVLNAIAAGAQVTGGVDNIIRVVRLNCFVNSAPGFTGQAKVANGASELLQKIFGPAGGHTRCAIGAAELPLNTPIELDLILEVE